MNIQLFKEFCMVKDQLILKEILKGMLKPYYSEMYDEDGFLYVPSENVDIMLTAHMDTVHPEQCEDIYDIYNTDIDVKAPVKKKALWSPQGIGGDDRCGISIIFEILQTTDFRPAIVFCEDEEVGGKGSDKFATWLSLNTNVATNIKYIIEVDRKHATDAVFYDCGNDDFIKYIEDITKYKEADGTFSDIGNISPILDIASVNLSCGYYNEHTISHYVIPEEMEHTFEVVKRLLEDAENVEKFAYEEIKYSYSNYYRYGYGGWGYGYGSGYDYDDYYDDYYWNKYNKQKKLECADDKALEEGADLYYMLVVAIKNGSTTRDYYTATDYEQCVGKFLMDNPDLCYDNILYVGDPDDYDDDEEDYYYGKYGEKVKELEKAEQ